MWEDVAKRVPALLDQVRGVGVRCGSGEGKVGVMPGGAYRGVTRNGEDVAKRVPALLDQVRGGRGAEFAAHSQRRLQSQLQRQLLLQR